MYIIFNASWGMWDIITDAGSLINYSSSKKNVELHFKHIAATVVWC